MNPLSLLQVPEPVASGSPSWAVFLTLVFGLLALDLGVFHRKVKAVSVASALRWSSFWIGIGMAWGLYIYWTMGQAKAGEYLACYVSEEALSVDNLFVFLAIFTFFKVPPANQHRVLFWGILGAMAMRGIFIFAGSELIHRFEWVLYVFGAFLVFTGFKLLVGGESEVDPEKTFVVRLTRKLLPISPTLEGERFFTVHEGRRMATPLLLVLVAVEASDVIFAVDSVPVAFGITRDAYIIYTANIMAILGLRSIYFALAALAGLFAYLKYGLSLVLIFIGGKMIYTQVSGHHLPNSVSLSVVLGLIGLSILASLLRKTNSKA